MRKTYTLILMLAMMFVGANSVKAQTVVGDFTYGFYTSGNAYITAYSGSETILTIPATVTYDKGGVETTVNVTGFGAGAFEGNTTITKIYLPRNAAYTTGARAFKGCTALNTIAYSYSGASSSLTKDNRICVPTSTLAESAFEGCTSIQEVYCAYKLTGNIGNNTFKGCTSLEGINAGTGYTSIGASAFEGCTSLTRLGSTANTIVFATGLTTIGANAFAGCNAITNVVAPWATPIEITEDVFSTTVYENATLDYPAESIDAYKAATGWQKFFKAASAFTAVFNLLGTDGETVVGTMQLNLQTMEVGDGVRVYNDDAVAAQKLTGDAGILDLRVVKDGDDNTYPLVEIGKNAFKGVADVTNVWLTANTLTTIGESAFENCENLVAFSSNAQAATLLNIGAYAFRGTPLSQLGVNVGKYTAATSTYSTATNPLTIDDEAFKGTQIRFVVNGTNIRQLGEGVFEDCAMLKNHSDSVLYLSALTAVPARTFKNCSNLVHVSLGLNKCTEIGESAFEGCTSLSKVAMDAYQTSETYARLSDKLTAIGANAFKGCATIRYVVINNVEAPTLGEGAFSGIKSNAAFIFNSTTIKNSYKFAGNYAKNDSWKAWFNGSNANYSLYAYVDKTNQYGTVSCDVPLNFTSSYAANIHKVVAADDSYSYLKAVSSRKLPANTGAVVEMAKNGATFRTSAQVKVLFDGSESADEFTDNLLVANVTENTNFKGQDGNTYNLLMSNGKFVKATDGTLAAGLAYLPKTFEGGEAKELSISFDEPTGIRTIDNVENTVDNDAWYTVNGVRLQGEPATKGVYIHNGKKVVVK